MSDHLVVFVDRLVRPAAVQSAPESAEVVPAGPAAGGPGAGPNAAGPGPSSSAAEKVEEDLEQDEGAGEEEPLIQTAECRICQEEDSLKDLETPCACSGSLKVYISICLPI